MWSIISILVENKPGVLFKVTHLFRSRNFNIDSISVGITDNPNYSKMTITTYGDEKQVEQIVKQLDKAIKSALSSEVATVIDITIDPEEDVLPFVAPGTSLSDMILPS